MLDPLFSFVDPIIELSEDNAYFVIPVEAFFYFMEKTGLDRIVGLPEGAKVTVPLDIIILC